MKETRAKQAMERPDAIIEIDEHGKVTAAEPEQNSVLRGCRDMLREAAKQFRLSDDPGHAKMCDRHADAAERGLK